MQQLFEISIKGKKDNMKVAGCKVGNGVFQKGRKARVVRNGTVLHTGMRISFSILLDLGLTRLPSFSQARSRRSSKSRKM